MPGHHHHPPSHDNQRSLQTLPAVPGGLRRSHIRRREPLGCRKPGEPGDKEPHHAPSPLGVLTWIRQIPDEFTRKGERRLSSFPELPAGGRALATSASLLPCGALPHALPRQRGRATRASAVLSITHASVELRVSCLPAAPCLEALGWASVGSALSYPSLSIF